MLEISIVHVHMKSLLGRDSCVLSLSVHLNMLIQSQSLRAQMLYMCYEHSIVNFHCTVNTVRPFSATVLQILCTSTVAFLCAVNADSPLYM